MLRVLFAILVAGLAGPALHAAPAAPFPTDVMRRLHDPRGGLIVVAHRGCHDTAPENSRMALLRCAAMRVDVMETDVRRSRDGHLVMVHDDRVDRTTDGTGKVSDLTLAQLKALRLRMDEGGPDAALTDEHIPTLDELLALAKGRIVLNLDVKDAIYAEVIDAARRAGAADRVIVKTSAGIATPPLAAMPPYDRVPFMVIPTTGDPAAADLPDVMARQLAGRVRPVAIELPVIPERALPAIAARAAKTATPLWVNTLLGGFVAGIGGDTAAERDPAAVWGRLADHGVRIFQTDRVAALLRYRATRR